MRRLVVVRLLGTAPLLVLLATFVFVLTKLNPVDPVVQVAGEGASAEQRRSVAHQLGLDRPLPAQFGAWLGDATRGDLGTSLFTGEPVLGSIRDRLPVTLSLAAGGILVALLVGLPAGVFGALRPGSAADRLVTVLVSAGLALPGFWLGLLLALVFAVRLRWFPVIGYTPVSDDPAAWARGMVLPAVAISLHAAAVIARQTRSAMIEALRAPYVRSLRAMGVPERSIVGAYALKNAMGTVLPVIGLQLSIIVVISFVIEKVFGLPGVGILLLDGIIRGDLPVVQGTVLFVAALVVIVNLAVDICHPLLDPKVRPQ
ncbi:MAG: ABC transporter permease [Sporichthyaceae bacterium]|nr:ABC transporter permease [Sporichthyaceae bacterium]